MGKRLTENLSSTYLGAANSLRPKKARKKIVAYVESYDDISFWRSLLAEYENDKRYFEVMLPSRTTLAKGKKTVLMNQLGKQANAKNDTSVQLHLALNTMRGINCRQNLPMGMKWLEEAAKKDHFGAQFYLGFAHLEGQGAAKNKQKAIEYLRKAAPWDVAPPRTPKVAPPRTPKTPKRSLKMVQMTKKSITVHHKQLIKKPDARHTFIVV